MPAAENPHKLRLAALLEATGLGNAALWLQRALCGPHLRAVYYHSVPLPLRPRFAAQLRLLCHYFVPVGMTELLELHQGRWPHKKPGVILSFDDGCRSHAEIVAPLLDHQGIPGWFFVPVGLLDTPAAEQPAYATAHEIAVCGGWPDARVAMTWEDARRLIAHHVVGCHTVSHQRLEPAVAAARVAAEVVVAKTTLAQRLGREVDSFAWVGGDEPSYSAAGAAAIRSAGYRVAFMTNAAPFMPGDDLLQIQRTNLEAHYPLSLVRFQLSGVLDVAYVLRRARVERLTAATGASCAT